MKITKNLIHKAQKGFTLIELLIVIAVLGVLAAAVLAALNPIEQINRGQDAAREDSTGQLGRAVLNYQTSQQQLDFSTLGTNAATWQTQLINSSEIKQQVTVTAVATNCNTNNVGGVCFNVPAGNASAQVWTNLASKSEWTRAGCTGTQVAIAVWDSSQGRAGVGCVATAQGATNVPAAGITMK